MALDSLLASLKSEVAEVTGVQASRNRDFACNPTRSARVAEATGVAAEIQTATPETLAGKSEVTAQPAPIEACTHETPATQKTIKCEVGDGDTATVSRWWLLHYPDRDLLEVACFPEATHADILERHPDAVAAEPIPSKPAPVPACNTCQHRPLRHRDGDPAPCGDPVAAGLSDVPGVIRYSPDNGKTCKAWRARLDPDLERRILAMAERWHYSGDELALALDGARSDPDGWRRVLEHDEGGE